MALTPNSLVTPQKPFSRTAVTATANTNFAAPTATTTLLALADNVDGARISRVVAMPLVAVGTASNCQLYAYDGTNKVLIDSALMATVSPAAAVANPKTDFGYSEGNALYLRPGWGLEVAPGQALSTAFRCEGGFY